MSRKTSPTTSLLADRSAPGENPIPRSTADHATVERNSNRLVLQWLSVVHHTLMLELKERVSPHRW